MTYSLSPDEFELPEPQRQTEKTLRVELAIECVSCGYSLEGLEVDGECPECAEPVSRSVRGELLLNLPLDTLKSVHHGTLLVSAGGDCGAGVWVRATASLWYSRRLNRSQSDFFSFRHSQNSSCDVSLRMLGRARVFKDAEFDEGCDMLACG